ncbi:hypothetical protein A584_04750 [Pseudomonas syringae pv. theae ICMP 3923]|nr:hypothetical protein A584_04750 [Pseudomonas syringae pv. theae ICMP 3923]
MPTPPDTLFELFDLCYFGMRLTLEQEVWEWLQAEILADTGSIHNEDHAHLIDADIRVIWTRPTDFSAQATNTVRPRFCCWIFASLASLRMTCSRSHSQRQRR